MPPRLPVIAIAAYARLPDGRLALGSKNGIPWKAPADMRAFRKATLGHMVAMGRKTWESLKATPLKGRANFIISRTPGADPQWADARRAGAAVVPSLNRLIDDLTETSPPGTGMVGPILRSTSSPDVDGQPYSPADPNTRVLWIIGGAEIYRQAMAVPQPISVGPSMGAVFPQPSDVVPQPIAGRLLLTEVMVEANDPDTFLDPPANDLYEVVGEMRLPGDGPICIMREYALRTAAYPAEPFLPHLSLPHLSEEIIKGPASQ